MQQAGFNRCAAPSALLSLTRPNRDFLQRYGALLRRAVPAGLPLPADAHIELRLNLDEHLIEHKESTFFMRVAGDSMRGLGISDGDLLVVDRALPALEGCVVIAVVDGEFTVKQLRFTPHGPVLHAAHPDYPDMPVRPEQDFSVWGVVKWSIRKV
jgi:DNA polymerase V